MKRRTFVLLSVMGAAAIAVPYASCKSKNAKWSKAISQPLFLSHVCDVKSIQDIGTAYREKVPEEASENKLIDLILADASGNSASSSLDSAQVVQLVDQNIQNDFSSGKTFTLKGWVLSATEARQCALFTLLQH